MRRPLRLLLLVVLGVAAPLVVLEVVLRIADPFGSAEVVEREEFSAAILKRGADGELELRPGARGTLLGHEAVIGAHGLRNPPIEMPKPVGTFRVLLLGDSVVFGWGVAEADALPRVLERLWNAAGAPTGFERVEVVNAGVPGWGAPNELVFLRDRGLAFDPDLVLVTLINNDLTDVLQAIAPGPTEPEPLVLPGWVRATYVGRAIEHGVAVATGRTARPDFFVALDLAQDAVGQASTALCVAYGEMRRLCGSVPFAVVDTIGAIDGSRRLDAFAACCESGRIARIEAYLGCPDYRQRFSVSPTDDHPNAAGHRLLADAVLAWARARFP